MKRPLSQLNNSLLSKVGGRSQANIPNLYSLYEETAMMMMGKVDLPSSIRIEPFVAPFYNTTSTIVLPDDFSLDGLIAVRPQDLTQRTPYNTFINANQFNAEQMLYTSTITTQNGTQFLNAPVSFPAPTVIGELDDLTNGTWSAVGATTNIRADTQFYVSGGGSIAFLAGAGPVNGIENSTLASVSASGAQNILVWLDSPSAGGSFRLSVGSSSGNYYYQTITASYFNQPIQIGFNLLRMDLDTALQIGTPDLSAITYVKFEVLDTLGAPATYRLDNLIATGNSYVNLEYYSNSIFMNAAGQRISIPTSSSDFILLNEKEYPIFLRQFSEIANTDVRPVGANTALAVYGGNRLDNMYEEFKQNYPSRRIWQADDFSSGQRGIYGAQFPGYGTREG